jgi:arylsulfatase A-like enzyme
VLPGDAALIIEPGRMTLASMLKQAGYRTGVVGKWHLGLGTGNIDWNGDIKPGPLELGFDYCFLMPATGDRVPCVYVENHRVVGLDPSDPIRVSYKEPVGNDPTGKEHPELLKLHPSHGHDQTIVNGVSRIGSMSGGKSARWIDEDMADVFTAKAKSFIEQHASAHAAEPFFLYFATHDIHVPRRPHARFKRKSGLGARGDAILQFDWCVGEILATLDRLKLADNTLVIVSSDNGPVLDDGYIDGAEARLSGHQPAGELRGGKYSNFEGGTRVPFITRWPNHIPPGVSDALICQMDLLASLADLTGQTLVQNSGATARAATAGSPNSAPDRSVVMDSENMLDALLGDSAKGRDILIEHAGVLAIRQGNWKLIEPSNRPKRNDKTNINLGNDSSPQLYNLDPSPRELQYQNVASDRPTKVAELMKLLEQIRAPR